MAWMAALPHDQYHQRLWRELIRCGRDYFRSGTGLASLEWGFGLLPDRGFPAVHDKMVQLGLIATFMFLVAGASRLARFNIQLNAQPSNPGRPGRKYFVGLPIPAGAGVVAATSIW